MNTLRRGVLISSNRYRPARGRLGTRPRIDGKLLGSPSFPPVAPAPLQRPWREWSAPAFEVDADARSPPASAARPAHLDAPLRFRILPAALEVRIAAAHPGASPSAAMPEGAWETVLALARIAMGIRGRA
jgi:hypothetical protein